MTYILLPTRANDAPPRPESRTATMSNMHRMTDATERTHLTPKGMLGISAFWAASNFVWGALIVIVVQSQINAMAPTQKGPLSGLTISIGAIAALIIPLIVGPMSDRCKSRIGRRRPYMIVGVAVNALGLALTYFAGTTKSVEAYIFCYFIMTVGNNIATAAYSGIIPDLVPDNQRGTASGYMAVLSQLGTLFGIVIAGQFAGAGQYLVVYAVLCLVLLLGLGVSMVGIKEVPLEGEVEQLDWNEHVKSLWIDPREHPDFAWVWITRALVMLGFYAFQPMVQYYLKDVINVQNAEETASIVGGVVIMGAAISGYVGGLLSDRLGRKRIVYFANSFMAIMCIGFIFCTSLTHVLIAGSLFGIGYGAYISVDWALGTDVLPNKDEDAAKDMAVWHISMTLPQAVAAYPAGLLVSAFGSHKQVVNGETIIRYTVAGYSALLICSAIFLATGAILLRNVKGAR